MDASVYDGVVPVLYDDLGGQLRAETDVIDDGDMLEFVFANPATANDVYVFDTSPLVRGNNALAKTGLDRIRVVPNPYYNRSTYELSQFNRDHAVHQPAGAGDGEDLQPLGPAGADAAEDRSRPTPCSTGTCRPRTGCRWRAACTSITSMPPGSGRTFGRLVVFMEKERLNTF